MWLPDRVLEHLGRVHDEPDLSATRYRLVRELGRGGMGVVYQAVDTQLEREVAVKVAFQAPAPGALERLEREARVIARLEHPAIVPVHDLGCLPDGRVYYVMKLVHGERLDAWTRGQGDRRVVLRLFQRICEAVAFAHSHGVLHRDLKPANVMVGSFGEALVMDWGLASVRAAPGDPDGAALGTPGFMSPEQARGELSSLDERADVYGLGATLSSLLSTPVDPLARPLAAICAKATAPARADRYGAALELADDIGRFLGSEPVAAYREGPLERALRFGTRHRVVLSLLVAYLGVRLLLIGLAR